MPGEGETRRTGADDENIIYHLHYVTVLESNEQGHRSEQAWRRELPIVRT